MLLGNKYRNISFFCIAILAVLHWGFYRTYIQFFPDFKGFKVVHHIHGTLMLLWVLLLIVQPFLISMKRYALHRTVGKSSYILAPLVTLSIFMVSGAGFHKMLSENAPEPVAVGILALNLPGAFGFAAFYILAMLHRKQSDIHMRYMIGTALLMIGPGLGRGLIIYGNIPFESSVSYSDEIVLLIAFALLLYDIINRKNIKPYLTIFLVLLMAHIFWLTKMGLVWQFIGGGFSKIFY